MTSLAPAEEPHILSNQALRFVAEQSAESVFSVQVCPRSKLEDDNVNAVKALDKLMRRVGKNNQDKGAVDVDAKKPEFSMVTGFSIGKAKDCLTILTVSHVIEEVYYDGRHLTAGSADSSSVDILKDINTPFHFDVICVHQERLLKKSDVEDISKLARFHTPAEVVAIDTRVDLLALKCQIEGIYISEDAEYSCPYHDTSLAIADLPAPTSETVLLQGWPYLLSDFQSCGNISVNERPYNVVDKTNQYGYQMKLIEIPRMKCVSECSGGPVVVGAMAEGRLCYVGVYFKTIKNSGYAVNLHNVKEFFT
ncbi:hypothetical protein ACQ4PT_017159 [Festuca glaucescens]